MVFSLSRFFLFSFIVSYQGTRKGDEEPSPVSSSFILIMILSGSQVFHKELPAVQAWLDVH